MTHVRRSRRETRFIGEKRLAAGFTDRSRLRCVHRVHSDHGLVRLVNKYLTRMNDEWLDRIGGVSYLSVCSRETTARRPERATPSSASRATGPGVIETSFAIRETSFTHPRLDRVQQSVIYSQAKARSCHRRGRL